MKAGTALVAVLAETVVAGQHGSVYRDQFKSQILRWPFRVSRADEIVIAGIGLKIITIGGIVILGFGKKGNAGVLRQPAWHVGCIAVGIEQVARGCKSRLDLRQEQRGRPAADGSVQCRGNILLN